jgi:hypothetical protein
MRSVVGRNSGVSHSYLIMYSILLVIVSSKRPAYTRLMSHLKHGQQTAIEWPEIAG